MSTVSATSVQLAPTQRVHKNLSTPQLVEAALERNEGILADGGTLLVRTGERCGRSPKDKWLEDTAAIHDNIWWGKVNRGISTESFDKLLEMAKEYITSIDDVFVFEGFIGADEKYRLTTRVYTELAWHSLFVKTLFIEPDADALDGFDPDWTIINCGKRKITSEEAAALGVNDTGVCVAQSLERKTVLIFGTEYSGEMKKSLFYAMNYDMPDVDVFPMHCSANVDKKDDSNVALFFGLSGTGKTTLSADPNRALIGDDEHGWSDHGVFNFEGGCYAKCIDLTEEGEPQIWNAIRFGSVLENVVLDDNRCPDYTDSSITENTRVTYPVEFIKDARIPSVGNFPTNVIFLTADAFGVLPAVAKLSREQAMYYFINGYTSKLAGTEEGVTEPQPNFSPCFGGPFLARSPMKYAEMLAERIDKHGSNVWLVNTGWHGTDDGSTKRYRLPWTRGIISAILNGELAGGDYETDPIFNLSIPTAIPGDAVPSAILNPRNNWADHAKYDETAKDLAARFRANDANFEMADDVRNAGPRG